MSKKTKKQILVNKEEIDKKVDPENRKRLTQSIIQLTEQKVEERFSDRNLDRKNEKIQLLSGAEISLNEIKDFIALTIQEYRPKFKKEFYKQINRLNNWKKSENNLYQKPPIVGLWTNEIIYCRFKKDVLPALQILNPYSSLGIRLHKHFQWLTDAGQQQLEGFIEDCIRVMQTCTTWYEFRIKYAQEFGLKYQLRIFEQ